MVFTEDILKLSNTASIPKFNGLLDNGLQSLHVIVNKCPLETFIRFDDQSQTDHIIGSCIIQKEEKTEEKGKEKELMSKSNIFDILINGIHEAINTKFADNTSNDDENNGYDYDKFTLKLKFNINKTMHPKDISHVLNMRPDVFAPTIKSVENCAVEAGDKVSKLFHSLCMRFNHATVCIKLLWETSPPWCYSITDGTQVRMSEQIKLGLEKIKFAIVNETRKRLRMVGNCYNYSIKSNTEYKDTKSTHDTVVLVVVLIKNGDENFCLCEPKFEYQCSRCCTNPWLETSTLMEN